MAAPEVRKLRLWQDRIETEVEIAGSGPPLVYLHGPWGLGPDRAFVARLAGGNTVYAPKFPGTSRGDHEAVHALDNWLDLVVYHGELFDKLGLAAPALVGHSFGGLVAAEFAAAAPKSVGRLALIDPVGLWRDDLPVKNWMLLSDDARRRVLFRRSRGRSGAALLRGSERSGGARRHAGAIQLGAGLHRQVRLADRRPRIQESHSPRCSADADRLGQGGRHHRAGLCAGVRQANCRSAGRTHRQGRTPAASRAIRGGGEGAARFSCRLSGASSALRDELYIDATPVLRAGLSIQAAREQAKGKETNSPESGPREGKHAMATSSTMPAAAAAPVTSTDRWTSYNATVLAICILGWAFDIYEATIMQLVTPLLIKEWGITPATMGFVTTMSRWIGLIGTFAFPVFADLYGRKPALIWAILGYSVFTGLTGFSTGWITLLIFSSITRIALAGENPVGMLMVTETAPTKWRATALGGLVGGYPFGYMLCSPRRSSWCRCGDGARSTSSASCRRCSCSGSASASRKARATSTSPRRCSRRG